MAGYRFIEICFSFTIGFFNSAVATSLLIITSKDTVFIINNRGHQISFLIRIYHSLLFYYRAGFGCQLIPNNRQHFFQFLHFLQLYRRPCISLNATFTFTSVQITKELFPKHIQRHNYIINLYHLQYLYQTKKAEFYPALPIIEI